MLPAALATLSEEHYRQQQQTARATASTVQAAWHERPQTGLWQWWQDLAPALADKITRAQATAAHRSGVYTDTMAVLQGGERGPAINPAAFRSPADEVAEWLQVGPKATFRALLSGAPQPVAARVGLSALVRTSSTLTQDAGREAGGVALAGNPTLTGYYRKLGLPCCDRCAVLAGKRFSWNADFDRHPRCDCTAVPAADSIPGAETDVTEAIRSGKVHGLSEADRAAILDDGADPAQVINAHRAGAVQTTKMYGRRLRVTNEGTTKRGLAGARLGNHRKVAGQTYQRSKARLTPSEIYRQADDRDHARRLLFRHGYLLQLNGSYL